MKPTVYLYLIPVFLVAAFFVVTYASGYKIDITNRQINQTGIISVQADEADIYINGELVGNNKISSKGLPPKEYNILAKREGYYDWKKTIELEAGEAEVINGIIMFKTQPTIAEYKADQTDFFNKLADMDGLQVANDEIYQNNNFVTRFAQNVTGVCWYPDRRYIAYTYDNKLKIMEIDATNEVTLLDKKSTSPVVFLNSGRSVIYESDGKVYRAEIR